MPGGLATPGQKRARYALHGQRAVSRPSELSVLGAFREPSNLAHFRLACRGFEAIAVA
jgi:hypothetical protein